MTLIFLYLSWVLFILVLFLVGLRAPRTSHILHYHSFSPELELQPPIYTMTLPYVLVPGVRFLDHVGINITSISGDFLSSTYKHNKP